MSIRTAYCAIAFPTLLMVSGCGVEGDPEAPPAPTTTATSVAIGVGSGGVSGGVATTVFQGNSSVTIGVGSGRGCRGGYWGRGCW